MTANEVPEDTFNCPECGAHDYGMFAAAMVGCPHCKQTEITELRALLAERDKEIELQRQAKIESQNRVVKLLSELDAAKQRAERAGKDAERYRWLADKVIAPDYGDNPWRAEGKGKGYWIDRCKGPAWIEGATLDAAIDAALDAQRGDD